LRTRTARELRNRGERTVPQVADDLGVNANQRHRSAAQFDQSATAKRNDKGEALEDEVRRLRKGERAAVDGEGHPKKAAAFFAKEDE
jgi:transposase-like protein